MLNLLEEKKCVFDRTVFDDASVENAEQQDSLADAVNEYLSKYELK